MLTAQEEQLLERGAILLRPLEPAKLTEFGKRWMDGMLTDLQRHNNTLRDVAALGELEARRWAEMERALRDEGVPTAITSGIAQYGMSHIIDHLNGKTSFTMPGTVAIALATTAPTSTTTGTTLAEASYTGYTEEVIAGAGFNAATAATPSVATNNGAITFPACTAGSSTLLGFQVKDNSTIGAGNALWYGTLTSVTISTTQTPPSIASGVLSLSINGT